ncbi:hypothetical protein PAXINDRAFT_17650 [Paxillus involutus ATCC 200175]|uniref:F-box domain-containing protein n=1 Tax=Paxillus involutus ATCC 200175 TaxID=664439 RepID=A0A0C9TN56_PAXIN|nr:hypothetical protein PAXINDRAFT_17650 [Paxillus involutus ATCC 200175]
MIHPITWSQNASHPLKHKLDEDSANHAVAKRQHVSTAQGVELEPLKKPSTLKHRRDNEAEVFAPSKQARTAPPPSILQLPNELLHEIIGYVPIEGLKAFTQTSSLFKEIAAPRYFVEADFKVPRPGAFWLSVCSGDCEALLLWRRTRAFSLPENIFFHMMSATDRELLALDIFFQSLPRLGDISTSVNLSCLGASFSSRVVASLLESIKGAGCPELTYSGNPLSQLSHVSIPRNLPHPAIPSRIKSLTVRSSILFAVPVIPFTFATLFHSPLTELILTDTHMSESQWTSLLRELHFSQLRDLEVNRQCSVKTLVTFLQRHPLLEHLSIHMRGQYKKDTSNTNVRVDLPSLHFLSGPPEYVAAVSRHLETPASVRTLRVPIVDVLAGNSQLPMIFDCADLLPSLQHLIIWFPPIFQTIPISNFEFPTTECRSCAVSRLSIHCSRNSETKEGSGVLWLKAFPEIKTLDLLRGALDQGDEEIRSAFANSDTIAISIRS